MVSKDVIADTVEDWNQRIASEHVLERDLLQPLIKSLSLEEVTVLTGIRRSGKTFMLYDLLKKKGGVYVNFEDDRLYGFELGDFEKLLDIVEEKGQRILYLDEVQELPGWEKFAQRVHRQVKLVVTGSNSCFLSADFSKVLVGRTKTFQSRPLNYREFLRFKRMPNSRKAFLDYMRLGGFPRIVLSEDVTLAREYLDRIVHRDIIAKNDIRNPEAITALVIYLLSNVGKEFSFRSLKEVGGLRHDVTVKQYLGYLQDAFLFKTIKRYHGSLRKQETHPKKIYAVDPALIGLGKRLDDDRGLVLENMVFNHLEGNWDIYFLRNGTEVDFVLCHGTRQREAVNVAFEIVNKETFEREMKGLKGLADKWKIKARLVTVYPVKGLPDPIEGDLAHRYLYGL